MKINTIQTYNTNITRKPQAFKSKMTDETIPNAAVMSLQSPDAMIKFQRDFKNSSRADAVQSNPISALGFKIQKALKVFFAPGASDYDMDLTNRVYLI